MVEFFQNIFNWFVIHKDEIVLFITSTNFVSFISAIVLLVKQIRATKTSTTTVNGLSDNLNAASKLTDSVTAISTSCEKTETQTEIMTSKLDDITEKFLETTNILQQKIQAILEVQSIVYNNLTDDIARKNIANILTSAKLVETSTVAELEKQIEDLQASVAEKMDAVKETVQETASKVKKTVSTNQSSVSRY